MLAWLTGSQKAANSSRGTSLIVSMETNRSLKVTRTLQAFLLLLKTNFTVESPELSNVWFSFDVRWTRLFSFHFVSGHLKVKLESMTVVFTDMFPREPRRSLLAYVSRRKKQHIFSGVKQQPEIRKDPKADYIFHSKKTDSDIFLWAVF